MKYFLSIPNPGSKFIEIEMYVENIFAQTVCFQLPSWRPGRYELGNFAKNIQKWVAFDEHENVLKFKNKKDSHFRNCLAVNVGAEGFEPPTLCL